MTLGSLLPQLRDMQEGGITGNWGGSLALPRVLPVQPSTSCSWCAGVFVGVLPLPLPPVPVLLDVFLCLSLSLFFWFLLLCPVTSLGAWWALALLELLSELGSSVTVLRVPL